jgi:hypothetical protein
LRTLAFALLCGIYGVMKLFESRKKKYTIKKNKKNLVADGVCDRVTNSSMILDFHWFLHKNEKLNFCAFFKNYFENANGGYTLLISTDCLNS